MYIFNAEHAANACVQWIRDWFWEKGEECYAVIGISGGKDSAVVAGLCKEALGPDRIIGVMLPDGIQSDINDSRKIIDLLGIHGVEYNIADTVNVMIANMKSLNRLTCDFNITDIFTEQSTANLPSRIRMSALYLIAETFNGRVSNNSNLSKNWIGNNIIYGNTAGDFNPISDFTISEVIEIGRVIGIPEKFLMKPSANGISGNTDEERLGFTYAILDRYLRTGEIDDPKIKNLIDSMHERNQFKLEPMKSFIYRRSKIGRSIRGAFWDEIRFGDFNERTLLQLQDEGFSQYKIMMSNDGELAVWARDEDEAECISENITRTEIDAYGHFDNPYITGLLKLDD